MQVSMFFRASELLGRLAGTANLVALYTGDSPHIAREVLSRTGLEHFLRFSVHATEARSREDMIRIAVERGQEMAGRRFTGKEIVVIGDSVRDVQSGKKYGTLTIAVATEFHTEEQLLKEEPDYLFKTLEDYDAVLEVIGRG